MLTTANSGEILNEFQKPGKAPIQIMPGFTPQKTSQVLRFRGFTLIELLMVIAVIGILASITFGISKGVQSAQNRTRAKAELAVIAQALEQFKSRNGDYPWATGNPTDQNDNAEILFQALVGWKEFTGSGPGVLLETKTDVPTNGPDPLVDISKLSYARISDLSPDGPPEVMNPPVNMAAIPNDLVFVDPWGEPYVYLYGKAPIASNTWEYFGFHLYSRGADREEDTGPIDPATGILSDDFRESGAGENLDNIYSQE